MNTPFPHDGLSDLPSHSGRGTEGEGQASTSAKPITIHVTNLTGKDAAFLSGVISFFTDPKYAELADQIRAGELVIAYGPRTGAAALSPAFGNN
jgi:hypothetical protein